MKYIRTKDGRIVEESNLEPGFKQTCITLIRKRDNKTLEQIICDDMDEYVEMIVVGEYCKCHKINPKEIRYERIVLLNEILKQSDTIEELCDEIVFEWHRSSISHDNGVWHLYHEMPLKEEVENALDDGFRADKEEAKNIYGAIWTDKGLIYVAKMNEKGELELL